MAEVLDWPRDNPAEATVRAGEELRQGRLIVVPTDTTYAILAHSLSSTAAARLMQITGECPALALADPLAVKDWLPQLSNLGVRLARHCWPGPFTLQSGAGADLGLCQQLPADVRGLVLRDGLLSLRSPGHAAVAHIARQIEGPVLMADLTDATCLDEIQSRIGTEEMLIFNDGPTYFGQPATVVRVEGKSWTISRQGVIDQAILADLVQCRILFVCTGNTCRSPLAMALCRKLLAEHLGCTMEELPARGFQVLSAGLAAMPGQMASTESVAMAQELGSDLRDHRSQPLSIDLLAQADCLLTMTNSHLRMLESLQLLAGPEPQMLCPDDRDISDPIGCDMEVYRQCAEQIMNCIRHRLPELLEL